MNKRIYTILIAVATAVVLFFTGRSAICTSSTSAEPLAKTQFTRVYNKLREAGVREVFIQKLQQQNDITFDEKFVKINVTGYLKTKPTDYSHNFNAYSIKSNTDFVLNNDSLLQACETKYGVPKQVIASILWVETKHGKYVGTYSVAGAFMSVALSDQPEYIEANKEEMTSIMMERYPQEPVLRRQVIDSLEKVIEQRAKKKAQWAVAELKALSEIDRQGVVNVFALKGSWAGAFGLSQFLPSSFLRLACDGNGDGIIDLFSLPDAAHSVGNYLKGHGWTSSPEAQQKAVFGYNNSTKYVEAVLTLAELTQKQIDSIGRNKP